MRVFVFVFVAVCLGSLALGSAPASADSAICGQWSTATVESGIFRSFCPAVK